MSEPVRRIPWPPQAVEGEANVTREWLVTNGLGGFASGTVGGVITRRYHGLLSAALPAPHGRHIMLSHLGEQLRFADGRRIEFGGREQLRGTVGTQPSEFIVEFRLEAGLPVWRYDIDGIIIERRVWLTHMQNTVHLMYRLLEGADEVEFGLRPSVNFRAQEDPVSQPLGWPYEFRAVGDCCELALKNSPLPPLRLLAFGEEATFTLKGRRMNQVQYAVEESRGYEAHGDLWSPGYFRFNVKRGQVGSLVASTESFGTMTVLSTEAALDAEQERRRRLIARADPSVRSGLGAELVLAADQFIISPAGRHDEEARARASGDEVRTVIAGYHWFTDWGRDTMISLEGLTLTTGRHREAGYILRTFAHYVRDGLIPNMFPEGEQEGLYHTADATLWFFHALARYVATTGDRLTLDAIYPKLQAIVAAHVAGTHYGIHLDPADGLITQGEDGYQLTWMDAKVDGWVVTPRRGKAVEINALWYNALRLMAQWAEARGDAAAREYRQRADQAYASFNRRFWNEAGEYLFDVVDAEGGGNDAKCRPNQIFAVSLPHPVLQPDRWQPVVTVVRDQLLTPVGLRSLAPDDPDFKPRYYGDLRTRDAAYHQGTVWGWLVGPFVDAWLKVYPDDLSGARDALQGVANHLDDACIGTISEIFDARPPFTPRGCIAQAWSVAEVLRITSRLAALERSTAGAELRTAMAHTLQDDGSGGAHMADDSKVLGDINPPEATRDEHDHDYRSEELENRDADESMSGGSQHDQTHHSGSRDVTEGTTGGTGTEVGGSRNFRTGTGATGGDIGNRPE